MVGSLDPNDKIGTHGLIAINQPVPYSIRFENAHTASAPAQDVVIVDQLDQSKLDLNTVRFSDITFAGRKLIVPPDVTTSYATSVLLNAGLRVDVSMLLDRFTGLLTWSFASIDPATLDRLRGLVESRIGQ